MSDTPFQMNSVEQLQRKDEAIQRVCNSLWDIWAHVSTLHKAAAYCDDTGEHFETTEVERILKRLEKELSNNATTLAGIRFI
ncbi:MAG: hypothetical protein OEZ68_21995 [Gammaproteobacteria bacterium]|nr:hypothetical protein [Gammaproteobacteria bacterium]MDH5803463.1 hypothetical protein [Gammaproteobacteria bacterium]